MALINGIRRAASRVVPLAIRASTGSERFLHYQHNTALNISSQNLLQKSFPSFLHRFSTEPTSNGTLTGPTSNETLIQAIESEIESLEADESAEVPQGFPFEIEDRPGEKTIMLTREFQGSEIISVEVSMPLGIGEENENNEDDDDDKEGEGDENQSCIPLTVKVSKKSGPSLEFRCTAYPDKIDIDSLTVEKTENDEEQIAYDGPGFEDLDEDLQKAFHKYLEIRGIKPSTTNFLHGYMIDKDAREYTTWLKNLQKFVQA